MLVENDMVGFYKKYKPYVRTLLLSLMKGRQLSDLDDFISDIMLRAWTKLPTCNNLNEYSTKGWMRAVTCNYYLDHERRRKIVTFVSMNDHQHYGGDNTYDLKETDFIKFVDTAPLPDKVLETKELCIRTHNAMSKLREHHRVVITMHYIQQKDVVTIAEELGVPEGTVKSRLFRGRDKLERHLNPYFEN